MSLTACVITVSDSCSSGESVDTSGPYLLDSIKKTFSGIKMHSITIPDDINEIENQLLHFSDSVLSDLIITTGGTGFTKRDVTPEATIKVIKKHAPGIAIAMCVKSLQITDMAMLSRMVCGIRDQTLIINLPGSLKAVRECYSVIENVLPHALNQIRGEICLVKEAHKKIQNPHSCNHNQSIESIAFRPRNSIYPMIDVDKAKDMIKRCLMNSIDAKVHPLYVGQVCLEDVQAPEPYPPFRASIKDGYACVSSDGKGVRKVRDGITAGQFKEIVVQPGECVRISTGAFVPQGADCVVQVEDTKLTKHSDDGKLEYEIEIMKLPCPGQDIRGIGSDIQKDETILAKFSCIGPQEYGLLHTFNIKNILSVRRMCIGVLSTGNEVKDANNQNIEIGCIRDSNRPMLMALLNNYADCIDLGVVSDERDVIHKTLKDAFVHKNCDIIVTSGGVSMGEKDLLKNVLTEDLNFEILIGRVNMKPGKPTTFASGFIDGMKKSIFGLPGNPVSAYVTCNLFVIPALKTLAGMQEPEWPRINVELSEDIKLDPRPEYARATFSLKNDKILPMASVIGNQISSRLTSLVGAQILLQLPSSTSKGPVLQKGSIVSALLLKNL